MPNLKEDMYSINTFSEGMNMDVHPSLVKNSTYQYAENIRIVTNDDGSTGVACNYDGVETIYDMRIFHVDPDKKTDDGKYTPSKNDERIIHVDSCRQYAVVFTREQVTGSDAHIDRIYLLDFTKDPKNRPVFNEDTCRTALGDLYRNSNKTLLRKNDETGEYDEISTNVVYENETSDNPSDDDINNRYIPLDRFSGTTWNDHFFCTLVRVGEYGIHQPISSTMIYESDTNVKIYWADGYNQIQNMNIIKAYSGYYLKNASKDATSIVPLSPYNSLFLSDIVRGGLKNGSYRYSYYLSNAGGSQSGVALPTGAIFLYKDVASTIGEFRSGKWGHTNANSEEESEPAFSNSGVKLKVFIPKELLDQYKFITIIRNYKPGLVNGYGESVWESFAPKPILGLEYVYEDGNSTPVGGYFTFEDIGGPGTTPITDIDAIYKGNSALSTIFSPRYLEQKDNILFAANIIEPQTTKATLGVSDNGEADALDFRAYPFNRYGKCDIRDNSANDEIPSWRHISIAKIGDNIDYINVLDDKENPVGPSSDCYIPYDSASLVESVDEVSEQYNRFFNYGFDKTFDFDTSVYSDPFQNPENAGKYWVGGCGPIVSYEFVTKEVAISDNKTYNFYGLNTVGSHDLSHSNGRVFDPKSDDDWNTDNTISINSKFIPSGTNGNLIKFSGNREIVNIEPDYKDGLKYAGGYNNPFIISNFRSLKRNEVYRYIIAFRTLGGKRCATFWIGDIKTPSSAVIPYFTIHKSNGNGYDDIDGDGSMVFANVLGIKFKFDIEVLKAAIEKADASFQELDSFEILRVQRSEFGYGKAIENKTVVATGVLQSLFHNTDGSKSWAGNVSGPIESELNGDENAAYYYDRNGTESSLQPTWFVSSYGNPRSFFPTKILRQDQGTQKYNDATNNIPYRTHTDSDAGSDRPDVTINWTNNNALYSQYIDGSRDTISPDNYRNSSFGSLFPASTTNFGVISPEFEYVMKKYISPDAEPIERCISDGNTEARNLYNGLGHPLNACFIRGNVALFSAVTPDGAESDGSMMYGHVTVRHDNYGLENLGSPLLSLIAGVSSEWRPSPPLETTGSYFQAFSSVDTANIDMSKIVRGFMSRGDTYNEYDGFVEIEKNVSKYTAVKSAGYSFVETTPKRSHSFNYRDHGRQTSTTTSVGGISTGCCDGSLIHMCALYNGLKHWEDVSDFFENIKDIVLGSSATKLEKDVVVAYLPTMSGGQNMVGRYYYQSNEFESTKYKYDGIRKMYGSPLSRKAVVDVSLGINDFSYANVIRTDRGRMTYGSGLLCQLYEDRSIAKFTSNTSLFTYMYMAPLTNYYNSDSAFSDDELDAINAALSLATFGTWYVFGGASWLTGLSGSTATLDRYHRLPFGGQNMICLTGGSSPEPTGKRGRTSPSHGEMLYVNVDNSDFDTITGCYASSTLDGTQPNNINGVRDYYNVMDYTTTLVVDVKVPFKLIGLNQITRQQIEYAPAGGAIIPLESDKFDKCRTFMYMTSKLDSDDSVYPSHIEQVIFSGDEYICIYDYTSTYLTRTNADGLSTNFGSINSNGYNESTEGDNATAKIVYYTYNKNSDSDDEAGFYGDRNNDPYASVFTEESISAQVQALIPIESQVNISLLYGYNPAQTECDGNVPLQRFEGGWRVKDPELPNKYIADIDTVLASKTKGETKYHDSGPKSSGEVITSVLAYNKKQHSNVPTLSKPWRPGSYYNNIFGGVGSISGKYYERPNGMNPLTVIYDEGIDKDIIQNSMSATETLGSGVFDCRVRYSATKVINDSVDSYTRFNNLDFIDLDSRFGPITGLYNFNNTLYVWQDSAFAALSVNERQLLNNENASKTALLIGTGGVLKNPSTYITTENGIASSVLDNYGIKNYASGVYASSDNAIYWYDHNKHEVLIYKGGVGQLSKMKGFQSWLNKYHDGFNAKLAFAYNPKYKEILMTFIPRDDMYYRADKAVQEPASTIVYSELIEAPTTFVTNNPTFYTRQFNDLYSFDKTAILRKHNVDSCIDSAKLRFVANDYPTATKVFDNVEYSAEFREPGLNFTTINFETPSMVSNNVEFIGRREDNYRFAIPRAKSDSEYMYPNRMKGKYLIENFEFNNGGGEFKLPSVITTFRSSYI